MARLTHTSIEPLFPLELELHPGIFGMPEFKLLHFDAGDLIVAEGDVPESLKFVMRGKVGVFSGSGNQPLTSRAELMIGLPELLASRPFRYGVFAMSQGMLGTISSERIAEILRGDESLRAGLLRLFASRITSIVRAIRTGTAGEHQAM